MHNRISCNAEIQFYFAIPRGKLRERWEARMNGGKRGMEMGMEMEMEMGIGMEIGMDEMHKRSA
jgi:hypothetical protein